MRWRAPSSTTPPRTCTTSSSRRGRGAAADGARVVSPGRALGRVAAGRGPDRVEGRFGRRTAEGPAAARVSGTTAPKPFPRRPSAQWALPPGKRRRDEEALAHIATGTERGAAALPRFSSLDALYSASILVDRRPRSDSHGSTGLGFEDGLFYDDDAAPFAFTDDQAPTI